MSFKYRIVTEVDSHFAEKKGKKFNFHAFYNKIITFHICFIHVRISHKIKQKLHVKCPKKDSESVRCGKVHADTKQLIKKVLFICDFDRKNEFVSVALLSVRA